MKTLSNVEMAQVNGDGKWCGGMLLGAAACCIVMGLAPELGLAVIVAESAEIASYAALGSWLISCA